MSFSIRGSFDDVLDVTGLTGQPECVVIILDGEHHLHLVVK